MAWRHGKYYVRSQRIGKRVTTEYVGSGDTAVLIAELDQLDRQRRQQERVEQALRRQQFVDMTKPPAALTDYRAAVRDLVADVLTRLGFRQHKRGEWRLWRMSTNERGRALFTKRTLTDAERGELRAILASETSMARQYGDMAHAAWRVFMQEVDRQVPGFRVAADARLDLLRREMGYDESSELERLLIDEVALCQFDYYRLVRAYAQATAATFTLPVMDEWDRVLEQKQQQYLRAVLTLAKVRRLLRLPAVQVNIGQQQLIGDNNNASYLP